jgi:hypothetical protein
MTDHGAISVPCFSGILLHATYDSRIRDAPLHHGTQFKLLLLESYYIGKAIKRKRYLRTLQVFPEECVNIPLTIMIALGLPPAIEVSVLDARDLEPNRAGGRKPEKKIIAVAACVDG